MSQVSPIMGFTTNPVVYFIDDEPDILQVLENFCLDHFSNLFEIKTFQSPQDAIALATQKNGRKPDAIVTDFRMPEMSGLELYAEIRNAGINCGAILLSGNLDKEVAIQAANSGIYQIVQKPFQAEKLAEALRDLLTRQQAERLKSDIRSKTLQLKEMYTAMRLLMSTRGPEFDDVLQELLLDPQTSSSNQRFEDVLEDLERRLEHLIRNEEFLSYLRKNAS